MPDECPGTEFDAAGLASALLHGLPDALVVSDAKNRITFWNEGATRIFGFSTEEAVGRSLDIIIPENLRARHRAGYDATMKTGKTRYGAGDVLSVPALCKDGRRISVQFSILPLSGRDGGLTGIAAIMRDVTADFEARKKLKAQLVALQNAPART